MRRKRLWWAVDGLWWAVLAAYVLAGVPSVPFHGDESTHIALSRDYAYVFQQHDLDAILYSTTPTDPAMQELRLLNGSIARWVFGAAWDVAGVDAAELNTPWDWGAGWDWNVTSEHLPSQRLLHAARWASALFTVISAWGVFAVARWVSGGRAAAYLASALYTTAPAVLLNGRRAMLEGALLAFSVLTVLAALWLLRAEGRGRARWWRWALLGALSGLAVAAKHTGALTVALVFAALLWTGWRRDTLRRTLGALSGAGALALAVFLLLNPTWWSDVSGTPARVIALREHVLTGQRHAFGSYTSWGARGAGLIRYTVYAQPQYFEDFHWATYPAITDAIAAYERTPWRGVNAGTLGALVGLLGVAWGAAALWLRRDAPDAVLLLVWTWGTALVLLLSVPFGWQRYYLPLMPPLAVLTGFGWVRMARVLREELSV